MACHEGIVVAYMSWRGTYSEVINASTISVTLPSFGASSGCPSAVSRSSVADPVGLRWKIGILDAALEAVVARRPFA